MNDGNLLIHFQWKSKKREILIRATESDDCGCSLPLYQVFRNNKYLFSIYPVINYASEKCWEMIEKEKEELIPAGFIGLLGKMIDEYYINA